MPLRYHFRVLLTATVAALGLACVRGTPRRGSVPVRIAELDPVEAAMIGATLDTLSRLMRDSSSLCVTILGGPTGPEAPSAAFLRSLRVPRTVVPMQRCPPTYTQMIRLVDSRGRPVGPARPAGYVDPYKIEIGRPQFAAYGYAWIYARQLQGTSGRAYVCTAIWQSSVQRVVCNLHREWLH
jgi:hypothetical protein